MDTALPWWLATPLLTALTALPVRFAAALLESERGSLKNSLWTALLGNGLAWIAALIIPSMLLALLAYLAALTLAAKLILRLSFLNGGLVALMAGGFATLVAILLARLGATLWP